MNCSRKITITICVVVVIIVTGVGYYLLKPKKYEIFEDLLVLEYGDQCSREVSARWENASASVHLSVHPSSQGLAIYALELAFLDQGVELCNHYENLVCNKITGTCDCGDPTLTAIFGERSSSKKFVAERGPGSGTGRSVPRKCRWAYNTFCFPSNYSRTAQSARARERVTVDLACTDGTTCKSKWTGKECSFQTILDYAEYYGEENLSADLVSGKVCTCQPHHPAIGVLAILH